MRNRKRKTVCKGRQWGNDRQQVVHHVESCKSITMSDLYPNMLLIRSKGSQFVAQCCEGAGSAMVTCSSPESEDSCCGPHSGYMWTTHIACPEQNWSLQDYTKRRPPSHIRAGQSSTQNRHHQGLEYVECQYVLVCMSLFVFHHLWVNYR